MHLRLLDKYVLKELLYPFLFGVASFSSIFIASSMLFKIVKYITTYGASTSSVAKLFLYSMPEIINYTFPMSVLLATLMAFGKLSGSSEIVAMKSGGISYYRMVAPVVIVGFIVSMFSVIWAEKVVPPSKHEAKRILEVEIKGDAKPKTQEHIVIKTLKGDTQRITYARTFNEKTGIMRDVTIEEFHKRKLSRIQTAKTARWEDNKWVLRNGNVYTMNEKEGVVSKAEFNRQVIPINTTPREISWEQKDVDEMTLGELRGYIRILERQKQSTAHCWTEIFMRFAIPLASLVFALVGAPLGTQRQRSGSSIGLGISVLVIFVYYAIMAFATGLGKGGVIPPFFGAMASNIIFFIAGICLLRKADY